MHDELEGNASLPKEVELGLAGLVEEDKLSPTAATEIKHLLSCSLIETTTGPLPPPGMLKRYEEICPGITKALVSELQNEGQVRRWCAKATSLAAFFGPLVASATLWMVLYYCFQLAKIGVAWGSLSLSIVALALVGLCITGSISALRRMKVGPGGIEVETKEDTNQE